MANTTIDTLQLDIVVNSNKATSNLKQTTNEINKLNNSVQGTKKGGGLSNLGKSLNFGALVGKLYFVRNITKRLSNSLANMVQYGIDFTETLNLWQTAMRGNIKEARTFISEMNKAYGIAEQTLMKYQATFKNMLSAMGKISEDTAYGLSESLTQMAVDFASLYNVSIDNAMTKFQAVLSGQVRPIRSISGYDITENTIYDLYKQMGGTKTMRQLDQTEKRLLRIYAVFQQMGETGALGDLQKTLLTNANQLRIMKEQATEFATWIGNGISYLVQESEILVKINALLITAKEIAKSWAYSLGYVEDDFTGIYESISDTSDEVDELSGKLLGFDKFQVLQDTSSTEDTDIESIVAKALESYQSLYKGVDNPAVTLANTLLESLGFHLETITSESTGATVEVWKLDESLGSLNDKLLNIVESVAGLFSVLMLIKHPIAIILTTFEGLYVTSSEFRENINDIVGELKGTFSELSSSSGEFFVNFIVELTDALPTLLKSILPIIKNISALVVKILPTILELINNISPLIESLMPIISTIIELLSNNLPTIVNIITKVVKIVTTIIELISPIANVILSVTDEYLEAILNVVYSIVDGISSLLDLIPMDLVTSFLETVLKPIAAVLGVVSAILETINAVVESLFSWNWSDLGSNIGSIFKNYGGKIASSLGIKLFADGGVPDRGSLFMAGEAGAELITNSSNGQSGVTNIAQFKQAMLEALFTYGTTMHNSETEQTQNININVGSQNWFNITRKVAQQNGYDLVKVR